MCFKINMSYEEYAAVQYLRKHLKLSIAGLFRLALHEWIERRKDESIEVHQIRQKSTWDKIQEHMASGKWHGLPDRMLKLTKNPDLDAKKYAAAAYVYGIHPDLAQLLTDYGLELTRQKGKEFVDGYETPSFVRERKNENRP
jgi:hypothetical protein